ncbi:MAG: 16S rRNA (guanine(527)-N(7))-methyltransferase RsmG [Hyphomonadaceae bacterium]|jgi:16S rRNA (guanine527-N7)-methyltransferase|nr:16S rRNA (guanine(527)-N(7))-methyltransferase RsmG [Hyphomonadaceae bacterium]
MEPGRKPTAAMPIRGPEAFAAAFDVSRETLARLATYEALLRQWQKAVNLVAPDTLDVVWQRHFADSAQLLPLAPPDPRHWIDLGSGGGFPGLVVAILLADRGGSGAAKAGTGRSPSATEQAETPPTCRSRVTLIESDARKAAFLREVVRQTGLSAGMSAGVTVDILPIRAESARIKVNTSLPRVICARALAPLDRLLGLAAPLSPSGTTGLFCKGKGVAEEVRAAQMTWSFDVDLVPSVTDRDGRIAVITRLERKAKD